MTVPPQPGDPRPHFAALRDLAAGLGLGTLSMGMSGDFEAAIAEGATMVRVGTAVFGPRRQAPGARRSAKIGSRKHGHRLARAGRSEDFMSVFRTAMVWLGLVDDDEYDDEEDQYYLDDEYDDGAAEPAPAAAPAAARPHLHEGRAGPRAPAESSPVTVFRGRHAREEPEAPVAAVRSTAVKAIPMPTTRVHVMDPRGFNDAQEVGDRLKNGQPVILNLQGVDRDLQRRLIDFSSGIAYALSGTMSKAADQVFLLTPANVEVSDEEKERLQQRGLYRASHL